MIARYFALVAGIIFLAVGVLGFIPGLAGAYHGTDPHLVVRAGAGYLLGLFPVNVLHDLVHLLIGAAGLAAYTGGVESSRLYARALAIVYALLTVMGLIPVLNVTFGLIPIFGLDILLHAASAVVAAYVGFMAPLETDTRARSRLT